LAEILSKTTKMPVVKVSDEPLIEQNKVYVIPPNRTMVVADGHLKLLPRLEGKGPHRPIDVFFQSLAETYAQRAIGVVLSGIGTDGTAGLEAIKAEGGLTFAQDESSQQEGMPTSAINSGAVDYVLPPGRMAEELVQIGRHPLLAAAPLEIKGTPEAQMGKILQLLHEVTGVDFTHYKATTLFRRITRRLVLHKLYHL
jgi:two-component system, chemotaxis family, CheB/CheR fusion protein